MWTRRCGQSGAPSQPATCANHHEAVHRTAQEAGFASFDGYVAGPNGGAGNPLGDGGLRLHEWIFGLKSWRERHGLEGGETGPDATRAINRDTLRYLDAEALSAGAACI